MNILAFHSLIRNLLKSGPSLGFELAVNCAGDTDVVGKNQRVNDANITLDLLLKNVAWTSRPSEIQLEADGTFVQQFFNRPLIATK